MKESKKAVLTGLGEGYFTEMKTEDTLTTAPEYETETYVSASLDKVSCELEIADKKIFASNKLLENPRAVKLATITLDAYFLPEDFEDKMSGMVEIEDGSGAYVMPTNPVQKFFRFGFPVTNSKGQMIVYNFPKCTLKPVSISGETEKEDFNEQVKQYEIIAQPLNYAGKDMIPGVYYKIDMTKEDIAKKHDQKKLLECGWYDKTSLTACKLEA